MQTHPGEYTHSYIDEYNNHYLAMPSTSEIGKALGVNKTTVYRYLIYMDEKKMIRYDGRSIVTKKIGQKQNAIDVPLSTCIPCGSTEEQEEVITDYLSVPSSVLENGEYFALKVTDDSMISADLHEGDILFVRRNLEAREGDLVAAFVEGGESNWDVLSKTEKHSQSCFRHKAINQSCMIFSRSRG